MTEPTDAELTECYKAANGEDVGKAQPLTTQRIFRAMRAAIAKWGTPPVVAGEPVAWWIPKAEQFCLADKSGDRPFAKAWELLYTTPQPTQAQSGAVPLTDEQIKALTQARSTAMQMAAEGRIPECGDFAAIAQNLDWLCDSFGIKGGQHG